jgi:hypothetical protein
MLEMYHFEWCVVLKSGHADDPSSAGFEDLLVLYIGEPEVDFCEILLDFESDAVEVGEGVAVGRYKAEEDVLPEPVAF